MELSSLERRLKFALHIAKERVSSGDQSCPYCGSPRTEKRFVKFGILQVRACGSCGLMFRYPKSSPSVADRFYEREYDAFERGRVTTLPTRDEVKRLLEEGFADTVWDARDRLRLVKSISSSGKVLDYGCSWGYFVVQARGAGFDAIGYEISRPRARFGSESFEVDIIADAQLLWRLEDRSFDIIYTSHVLEHLSSLRGVFPLFRRLLADNGVLLIFVPNCGGAKARSMGVRWGPFTSEAHTLSFDAEFFQRALPNEGFAVSCYSEPYWARSAEESPDPESNRRLDGDELFVVARKMT